MATNVAVFVSLSIAPPVRKGTAPGGEGGGRVNVILARSGREPGQGLSFGVRARSAHTRQEMEAWPGVGARDQTTIPGSTGSEFKNRSSKRATAARRGWVRENSGIEICWQLFGQYCDRYTACGACMP